MARKLTKEELERIFRLLADAESSADALYDSGAKGKRLSGKVELSGHAHRIAGSLNAVRNTIEMAAGMQINSSRVGGSSA